MPPKPPEPDWSRLIKNSREISDNIPMNAPQITDLREEDRQRTFRRFTMQFAVLINPLAPDNAVVSKTTAMVIDVSMSGLRFASAVDFPIESVLHVEITIGAYTHSVPVVVVRRAAVSRPGRTVYECGVQYIKSEATAAFIPILAKYLFVRGALRKE